MTGCDLCGVGGRVKRVSMEGFGQMNLCEICGAKLAAVYPGRRAALARELATTRKQK